MVSTACVDHEESSTTLSMKACTATWRAVRRSMATMTPPQRGHGGKDTGLRGVTRRGGRCRWRTHVERAPAAWQRLGATARGEEAVEPDPHEAFRQHVEAEAAEKFLRAEGHEADLASVAVVLPPTRHLVLSQGDEPMIG